MIYNETKIYGSVKIRVKVSLADPCKNGHDDFSITAQGWEKIKGTWVESFCGCCHDEITVYFPGLAKTFVPMHLSDFTGVPMYAVESGFYHANDQTKTMEQRRGTTCKYLRITSEEFDAINLCDEQYFHYQLEELGIVRRWQSEADTAIAKLEILTRTEFDPPRAGTSRYQPFSGDISVMTERIRSGYYSEESIRERVSQKRWANHQSNLNKMRSSFDRTIADKTLEYNIEVFMANKIYATGVSGLGSWIYYPGPGTICFNWVDSSPTSREVYDEFISKVSDNELRPLGISAILFEKKK